MIMLRDLQISWIRYKDTSLLTVGRYTYTTDLRFEAFHSHHTDDWIVRLKNPKPSDSGVYGCQISTTPHRTQLVYLTVHGNFIFFFCWGFCRQSLTRFWPFSLKYHKASDLFSKSVAKQCNIWWLNHSSINIYQFCQLGDLSLRLKET